MKQCRRDYKYEGTIYPAAITFKRMKSMTMRFNVEKGEIRVSIPNGTTFKSIDDFVSRHIGKMVKGAKKRPSPYQDGYLYVFGEQVYVGEVEKGEVTSYYKKVGLPFLKERVEYYSRLMGVNPPYRIRMRDMKRTLGSNSKATHTLTFQTRLMAYRKDLIDSVIVHELAHHFQFDHSPKFYAIVNRYYPIRISVECKTAKSFLFFNSIRNNFRM